MAAPYFRFMTLLEIKDQVQTLFPFKFEETIIHDEDDKGVDKLIGLALSKVLSKCEKIEGKEITGSQLLSRADSILKCVPSAVERKLTTFTVWDTMAIPRSLMGNVRHYFSPDRFLRLWPNDATVWIEYVVRPELLGVDDLDMIYKDWVVAYATALLKEKEGYLGTSASITTLPFEFNYERLLNDGREEKKELEETMGDMFAGTLAIRVS